MIVDPKLKVNSIYTCFVFNKKIKALIESAAIKNIINRSCVNNNNYLNEKEDEQIALIVGNNEITS